jgi:transposase
VIGPSGAVRVMVATKPVDFRKGAEGLAALVRETMAADPFSGAVYVFRAKRADRIKLVFWDGTGLCLFAKRGILQVDGYAGYRKLADRDVRLAFCRVGGDVHSPGRADCPNRDIDQLLPWALESKNSKPWPRNSAYFFFEDPRIVFVASVNPTGSFPLFWKVCF